MSKHLLFAAVWAAYAAGASQPEVKWTFEGQSNLYGPPLVAEMHANPGLETLVADSEAKRLRCISAQGQELWAYDGGWKKRLISAPALDETTGRLVIANADGWLRCVAAGTGVEQWRAEVGLVEWGGALWTDLDGDGANEVVVGLEENGVAALNADGTIRWHFKGKDGAAPVNVRCPLAVCDINGDGRAEIFGCGLWGPFALNNDGTLLWEHKTGDDFISAPVLAEGTLYCTSRNDHLLWALDAQSGTPRWSRPLLGVTGPYDGSSIAVGDIDQKSGLEIVAGDAAGHLCVFDAGGGLRWTFSTGQPVPIAASLGDVDGDGEIEVLAASGDHGLYCIDARGALEWKFTTGLRLVYPPSLADIDGDGQTDVLVCGSDHRLRCLSAAGRHRPELLPWPSRRADAAQHGVYRVDESRTRRIATQRELFLDGGFEVDKTAEAALFTPENKDVQAQRKTQPRGWLMEGPGKAALDESVVHSGKRALRLEGPSAFSTISIPLDAGLGRVTVSARVKAAAPVSITLLWAGDRGPVMEETGVATLARGETEEGWISYHLEGKVPPANARRLCIHAASADNETWWMDSVAVTGEFEEMPSLRALVNQVGYDAGAPKCFTAQANWKAERAEFAVLRQDGSEAFRAPLEYKGRIQGHYGPDWGNEYWRGDFSAFNEPGRYRVRILLDGASDDSWPFEVGPNVLWNQTSRPAYRFFYYQRCGTDVPGFHGPCHLDDAASPDGARQYDLRGGWHDAGDYNKYQNAPYVYGLARAYNIAQAGFDLQDEDGNARFDFLDEIVWGGEHTLRMIAPDGSAYGDITSGYGYWGPPEVETDNRPGTGDERRIRGNESGNDSGIHAAALARIAASVPDPRPWIEGAERGLRWALEHQIRGVAQFSTAVDLYRATQKEDYARLARELLPSPSAAPDVVDALHRYDEAIKEDHSEALRAALVARAEELLALAENPFGVYTFGPKEHPNYFNTPADKSGWHVGTSSHLLEAANLAALAYQYAPDPRYLRFAYDQFNWTLGTNPYDLSLMEGQGSAFPPSYHQRLTFAGVARGAVPGSVVNGITWRGPGDDRPFFDMTGADIPAFEPNEVWLPHNTNYLNALANLHVATNPGKMP